MPFSLAALLDSRQEERGAAKRFIQVLLSARWM